MTRLVADTTEEVLKMDKKRVGCFRRTGMLMELMPGEADKDIKPQGLVSPVQIPQVPDPVEEPTEGVEPEEQENGWTEEDMEVDGDMQQNIDEQHDVVVDDVTGIDE